MCVWSVCSSSGTSRGKMKRNGVVFCFWTEEGTEGKEEAMSREVGVARETDRGCCELL